MHIANLMTVTIISLLAVVSPGPDFLVVTQHSLIHSKKVGLFTAFGIALGSIIWVALSLAGISVLIMKTAMLFTLIKFAGALYLMYIGIQSLRSKGLARNAGAITERSTMSHWAGFKKGLLTNLLNPKAGLFFVSFFSVVLDPAMSVGTKFAYGMEIPMIALVWFSFVSTVLSAGKIRAVFERFSVWIDRATGAVLILLGVRLAMYDHK
jgi:RhtB (resistance to homoserine/threonine) family protein